MNDDNLTPAANGDGSSIPHPTTAGAIVEEHLPCVECGYDLHGLACEGACPECGWSVTLSIERWSQRDRKWMDVVHSGLTLLLAGHYAMLITTFILDWLAVAACLFVLLVLIGTIQVGQRRPGDAGGEAMRTAAVTFLGLGTAASVFAIILAFLPSELVLLVGPFGLIMFVLGYVFSWLLVMRVMGDGMSRAATRLSKAMAWVAGIETALVLIGMLGVLGDGIWSAGSIMQVVGWFGVILYFVGLLLAIVALHIAHRAVSVMVRTITEIERARREGAMTRAGSA